MDIINRWRKISRCYFWPPLLLGVVAAYMGIATNLEKPFIQRIVSSTLLSVNSFEHTLTRRLASSILLVSSPSGHSAQKLNSWQSHAIRRLIKQFAFYLSFDKSFSIPPDKDLNWDLLSHLAVLLSDSIIFYDLPMQLYYHRKQPTKLPHLNIGILLAHTGGIRAGPLSLNQC